jgi:GMP synthase (glutamine-hydrolysing)
MRKYLMIVPEATGPAGLIGETVVGDGATYDAIMPVDRHASHAPFDYPGIPKRPGDYAGLVVLGGPMSANDTEEHPFLVETMSLIKEFAAEDRLVLGICLGAQIIARAFGGEVYRMERLESGFRTMAVTAAGKSDPVFSALGADVTSFQNHFEAVRDIPDAVARHRRRLPDPGFPHRPDDLRDPVPSGSHPRHRARVDPQVRHHLHEP